MPLLTLRNNFDLGWKPLEFEGQGGYNRFIRQKTGGAEVKRLSLFFVLAISIVLAFSCVHKEVPMQTYEPKLINGIELSAVSPSSIKIVCRNGISHVIDTDGKVSFGSTVRNIDYIAHINCEHVFLFYNIQYDSLNRIVSYEVEIDGEYYTYP
jgi:hypothetical protein